MNIIESQQQANELMEQHVQAQSLEATTESAHTNTEIDHIQNKGGKQSPGIIAVCTVIGFAVTAAAGISMSWGFWGLLLGLWISHKASKIEITPELKAQIDKSHLDRQAALDNERTLPPMPGDLDYGIRGTKMSVFDE